MAFTLYSKNQNLEEAAFQAAMYWRIAYGSLRLFIGYKLLSLVGLPATLAYQRLFRHEFSEDPHDHLLRAISHALAIHGFSITYFLAAYLLFWGIMDIALSISMLHHYLWAFDISLGVMGLFIVYELFRISHTHSSVLFAFILIDAFILCLIYFERNRLIARREGRRIPSNQ